MKKPVRVAVTGAAGQIGYAILFRIASGEMLGKDQPVILQLIDIEPAMKAVEGVIMELEDCAFPLLAGVEAAHDPNVGFKDTDYAILVRLSEEPDRRLRMTDLAASSGTSIRAGADGVVTYVGFGHSSRGLTGWTIIVAHGNGLETAYNHMYSSGVYVSEGQAVRAGDVIGGVGSTGRSTGPHLHLTVWQDGEHINPKTFFSRQGVSF